MRIAIISFTRSGAATCRKLEAGLKELGHACDAYGKEPFPPDAGADTGAGLKPLRCSLDQWTREAFESSDALVFISACGIAVRAIAPYIRNKTVDPAVIVADEKGNYVISLLSGHLGGANGLTRELAGVIGAAPVITTATDLNGCFAVDEWAKKNGLKIGSMKLAKEISAAILRGETIGVVSDTPIEGRPPEGLLLMRPGTEGEEAEATEDAQSLPELGFRVSVYEEDGPFEKTLNLIPAAVTVGIGCRKGIAPEAAEELFYKVMKEHRISVDSVERLCSIDLKKDEAAITQLAERLGVPLEFYSAEELAQAPGEFTSSEFVSRVTGVDNVCERAAVLGSRGRLIVGKQSQNGVTVAAAVRTGGYRWKQE